MSFDALKASIAQKKALLDTMRPLRPDALAALENHYDIELTYASNAIEGNTLTASETQLVIEKGITIGGKTVREHLEAIDHFEALGFIRALANDGRAITETDVCDVHASIVKRSQPALAGLYADHSRIVLTKTGRHAFPNPAKVPALMSDFGQWLQTAPAEQQTAFDAHRDLVGIHPFNDGNGRTARLLMNLVLIRAGYTTVSVRPEDRNAYTDALATGQAGGGYDEFNRLLYERLDATMGEYVAALRQALAAHHPEAQPPAQPADHKAKPKPPGDERHQLG
jgi:Fic family protein